MNKKQEFASVIVYLLILAIALIYALTILRTHYEQSGMTFWPYFGYVILAIIAGVILNGIVFELGRLAGAKIGRYHILSFNVLGFCFYKSEGKTHFKFNKFNGLTGETRILPKEDAKKEPNPRPHLLYPSLFFLVEAAIIIPVFAILNRESDTRNIAFFLLTICVIGAMILIYDIMPFQLDSKNDGYQLTLTSNPKNVKAFNELLVVENAIANGDTNVVIPVFKDVTNFTAELNLNKVYQCLDNRNYKDASDILDTILDSKTNLSYSVYLRAKAQKIYIKIMTEPLDKAANFYEVFVPVDERREISMDNSMVAIRCYALMAGLLDKSRSECTMCLSKAMSAYKHTPQKRREIEIQLLNEAIDKISEVHKNWELEQYKLESIK